MRAHLREAFGFDASDFVYLLTGSGFSMKGLDRAIEALAAMIGVSFITGIAFVKFSKSRARINFSDVMNHICVFCFFDLSL